MTVSRLVQKLAEGGAAIGAFQAAFDLVSLRGVGSAEGRDFVILDMDHQPFDATDLRQMILNVRRPDGSFKVTPIVRVPVKGREVAANRWVFQQVLDAGALGAVVPHVSNAEEALAAVQAMRYPPAKDNPAQEPWGYRGWSSATAATAGNLPMADYASAADLWPLNPRGELFLAVMIESPEGVANLRDILAVPGVSAALIGPSDLHAQMGYIGQIGRAEPEALIQQALSVALEMNKPIGITVAGSSFEDRLAQGFRFIAR